MNQNGSPSVVIIDDDADAALTLVRALKQLLPEVQFHAAATAAKAIELVSDSRAAAVVLDLHLEPQRGVESGFALLQELSKLDATLRCIVLTGHGTTEYGVRALNLGAASFLQKPADVPHLAALLSDALSQAALRRELEEISSEKQQGLQSMLGGNSSAIQTIRAEILSAAATMQPVLIVGETGTGKGVCARAIHALSARRAKPFVRYQPTFATADLVLSDLFGHQKGAFTGASSDRAGLLREADGGTLFLDEIEELPLETQVALLGVLQERRVRPVGSNSEIKTDFRLVCASNENIDHAVENKHLRLDFYHRIAHVVISMPTLRERLEDCGDLARHCLQRLRERELANVYEMSASAEKSLKQYSWPGNVRELEAVVEGAAYRAAAAGRSCIEAADIFIRGALKEPESRNFHERVERFKLDLIQEALKACGNNQVQAAKLLGLDRSSMRRILRKS